MKIYHCDRCGIKTEHRHEHDTAYGMKGTHMEGSERFVCTQCNKVIHSSDAEAVNFDFILDK